MSAHDLEVAPTPEQGEAREGRSVVVMATFAAEPLLPTIAYWLRRHGLDVALRTAPYGQVLEQVAIAGSELGEAGTDLGVILIRVEDYLRDAEGRFDLGPASLRRASGALEELSAAIATFLEAGGAPLLLGMMPVTVTGLDAGLAAWARRELASCAESCSAVLWLNVEDAMDLYEVRSAADPFRDEIAHVPFSEECLAAVGTAVARRLRALWASPRKAIALDCDNTLWRGACSEDPIEELDPGGPFECLRHFMHEQAEAGRILCLVSRNPERDVERAFARLGAPLEAADIVARRCGWEAKSDSLCSLAAELDLDVDSFVFIDDDPLECAEVRERLPGVAVVELPPHPEEIPLALRHAWELDHGAVTEADRRRLRSYAANRRLREELERAESSASFLAGLNVRVDVAPARLHDLERVVQLFQRTNQFNSTAERPSPAELRKRLSLPGCEIWVVRVEDRLGDYGLVGALLTSTAGGVLRVEQMALSCRVFKRDVERVMLGEVLAAQAERPARLLVAYRESERNVPVRRLLDELNAEELTTGEDAPRWFELAPAAWSGCR
ncbi:MAG: HAD-IIIC family phosphatase [Solirubrobacterales bacterium]